LFLAFTLQFDLLSFLEQLVVLFGQLDYFGSQVFTLLLEHEHYLIFLRGMKLIPRVLFLGELPYHNIFLCELLLGSLELVFGRIVNFCSDTKFVKINIAFGVVAVLGRFFAEDLNEDAFDLFEFFFEELDGVDIVFFLF